MGGTSFEPPLHSPGNLRVSHTMLCRSRILPFYVLPIPRQHISTNISHTRLMNNLQIQFSQPLQPTSLPGIQMRLGIQVSQQLVVSIYCACVTMQVLPPLHTSCIYCHEFPVSHMIPCFSGCELLTKKCHRLTTL